MTEGGHIRVGTLQIAAGAALAGSGVLPAAVVNAGTLRPGAAGAVVRILIAGDYR